MDRRTTEPTRGGRARVVLREVLGRAQVLGLARAVVAMSLMVLP
jgi:hypothetical protein